MHINKRDMWHKCLTDFCFLELLSLRFFLCLLSANKQTSIFYNAQDCQLLNASAFRATGNL